MIDCQRRTNKPIPNIMFDPKYDLNRPEYLKGLAGLLVIALISFILDKHIFSFLTVISGLLSLYSSWVIIIKRLRYASLSPWISLCCLIPFISLPLMIFLIFYEGRASN